MIAVRGLLEVPAGGLRRRVRVRVIKPHDVEAARPGIAAAVDVRFRIDQEPIDVVGEIGSANRLENPAGCAHEQAAAFMGQTRARVRDDVVERVLADGKLDRRKG